MTEEDLENTSITLRDVQAVLLNMFSADTILIGHSLESDLFALKVICMFLVSLWFFPTLVTAVTAARRCSSPSWRIQGSVLSVSWWEDGGVEDLSCVSLVTSAQLQ